ncbi:helicase, putative, RecD/TraA family [Desulfocurvibacter africanus PCS]|uniref:Helicase, putative, RecD/TraA family n=1 Tax=Desulfocurvibacter africanus PCS TaxID=1262666 RepID=M5PYH6_DESAF|nr:ATP-dependent RecD-like DNA helicase [Desulfocurvibacter africanus]EMG39055.1 helicase, putative, RecD/TraA family [Desulfocurvibacter africanus PCS]
MSEQQQMALPGDEAGSETLQVALRAEVRQVVYSNAENGYCVLRAASASEPGLVTAVGILGQVTPGEMLELSGRWIVHSKFGRQFEVTSFRQTYPATEHGIVRYLSSGLIKGVGPKTAEALVATFGTAVLDIIESEPERLLEVDGIGKKTLERIRESWGTQRDIRTLMLFLQSHDVPTTYAARIYKAFGAEAVERLKENPYELAYLVRGIGFRTADVMAMKLGLPPDSQVRLEAAIVYALFSMSEKGHLFFPEDKLLDQVDRMLEGMESAKLRQALAGLLERKRVVVEEIGTADVQRGVYLQHFYRWEQETASRLYNLVSHPAPTATLEKVERGLPELEAETGIKLSHEQREAVLGAVANKAFIITGGPGTGKTTITRMVVRSLKKAGLKIKLAAPTGRAAKRLSEASGESASTLHRLLQYSPEQGFSINEDSKLKAEAVIIDEASMLDAQLFVSVLRALPLTCRLILVGDVNQLPSVGPGNILSDLLASQVVPSMCLTRIYRQAQESWIVTNAHRVNDGQFPGEDSKAVPPKKDFFWVRQDEPARVQALILQLVCERIPEIYGLDPKRDIQVLTPMHKGEVGTQALNTMLQERLNPLRPGMQEIVRGRTTFRPGDRVLQLRNNYEKEIYNGDLGWVTSVDPEAGEALVDFEGRGVAFEAADLDELTLAYAVSVHKSQGSEYPAVVVPMVTQHYIMLQRNLLYTALTRARELAVLIGSDKAVGIALRANDAEKRYTHLKVRLQELFNQTQLF